MDKGKKILAFIMCMVVLAGCTNPPETPKGENETAQSGVQMTDEQGDGDGKEETEGGTADEDKIADSFSLEEKYASYVPYEYASDTCKTWERGVDAEEELSLWYGTWYDEAGKKIEFTKETLGGRAYGVKRCYVNLYTDGTRPHIEIYYTDTPQEIWTLHIEDFILRTADGEVTVYNMVPVNEETLEMLLYYDSEPATRDALVLQDEKIRQEELANKESFTKEQVYNRATSDFEAYINEEYAMDERLFMYIEYQSVNEATYAYDSDMDEYKIRFKVTVDENIFAFGMYKYTCTLRATYTEENGRLTKVSFDVD